ncbi:MAG: pyridoxal phosphate-dependent aminotransferase family protein [Planctomycetaceae bacterium]|jgi:7-keto-8-aminopelargonate synthetase-like enzyme|nr:pyridoxal phosphate-dependent aminotransferase family protein [Planctomycetaceae bacterium]
MFKSFFNTGQVKLDNSETVSSWELHPTVSVTNDIQSEIEDILSFDGPPDSMITVSGRVYLYFAGNGYLGLQASPEVIAATCEAVLRYGVGTATTRTAFTSPPVFQVERLLNELLGVDRSLYTASGYVANQILIESIEGTFDRIFIDEGSHYSLFDAVKRIRNSRCRPITFLHRNINDLHDKLESNLQLHERPLIITDGVFSLLGTIAPIQDYIELLSDYEGASLLIDDAHGFGLLGANGLGVLEYFNINPALANRTVQDSIDDFNFCTNNITGTAPDNLSINSPEITTNLYQAFSLGKVIGGSGGIIPGSENFIQRIKDRTTVYHCASAPASPIAAATAKALSIAAKGDLRKKLHANAELLKRKLREKGIEVNDNPLPVVILTLGSAMNMRRIQKELSNRGILVSYLPRYAGLGSQGALRIAVFATHTNDMIVELTETLGKII